MKKINNILLIFLALALCSCQSFGNKKAKNLYYADIRSESISDVTKKYGSYNSKWEDDGNTIYNFIYKRAQYSPMVYFPILGYFGNTMNQNYEVILIYDKNNKFIEKRDFFNSVKAGTRLTCASCIKDVNSEVPSPKIN